MTISDRIFERLKQIGMTQKEFSEKTGINQSTVSEWKKNGTNPSSEKIMPICEAIGVEPEWLLSGIDPAGSRAGSRDYYTVEKGTEMGRLIEVYNGLDPTFRARILGYAQAFAEMEKDKDKEC